MKKSIVVGCVVVASLAFIGCKKKKADDAKPMPAAARKAGGVLQAKSGAKMNGSVELIDEAGTLTVNIRVHEATPGTHGIHLHEKGDCSAPDAASAGGHYNPKKETHGGPATSPHHAGDLGNISVSADGTGHAEIKVTSFTFDEAVGKAIVVHEKTDDLTTDPSGNSGARQGCAVIAKM